MVEPPAGLWASPSFADWMNERAEIELARAKLLAYRTGRTADGALHKMRGLRQLAREVGMSPTGLSQFLEGTDPYAKTISKVLGWYRSDRARSGEATADRSIDVDSMIGAYLASWVDGPGWLAEVRDDG